MVGANTVDLVAVRANAVLSAEQPEHRQWPRPASEQLTGAPLDDAFSSANVGLFLFRSRARLCVQLELQMVRDTLERVSISARSRARGQLSRFEWCPHSFVLLFYSVVFLNPDVHAGANRNGSLCSVGRAHYFPGEIAM